MDLNLKTQLVKTYGTVEKARKHFRLKWIRTLESGTYKQAKNELRTLRKDGKSYGYCCLGVLCNLTAQEDIGSWETSPTGKGKKKFFHVNGVEDDLSLPHPIATLIGLDTDEMNELVAMNDDLDKSFSEIATHLRKMWRLTTAG